MSDTKTLFERTLLHDKAIVISGILITSSLAWFHMAGMSTRFGHSSVLHPADHWSISTFLSYFLMWVIMMVAMMLPTAGPMILTFSKISCWRQRQNQAYVNTSIFVMGYITVSIGYSLLATLIQWWLHTMAMLTSIGASKSHYFSGTLLFLAGLYQWSSIKHACLRYCRNPLHFFLANWREGNSGSLRMGLRHGLLCTGCCWALMALMFVGGVMNLLWMFVITAVILIEKVAPHGDIFSKIAGGNLVLIGFYFIIVGF